MPHLLMMEPEDWGQDEAQHESIRWIFHVKDSSLVLPLALLSTARIFCQLCNPESHGLDLQPEIKKKKSLKVLYFLLCRIVSLDQSKYFEYTLDSCHPKLVKSFKSEIALRFNQEMVLFSIIDLTPSTGKCIKQYQIQTKTNLGYKTQWIKWCQIQILLGNLVKYFGRVKSKYFMLIW